MAKRSSLVPFKSIAPHQNQQRKPSSAVSWRRRTCHSRSRTRCRFDGGTRTRFVVRQRHVRVDRCAARDQCERRVHDAQRIAHAAGMPPGDAASISELRSHRRADGVGRQASPRNHRCRIRHRHDWLRGRPGPRHRRLPGGWRSGKDSSPPGPHRPQRRSRCPPLFTKHLRPIDSYGRAEDYQCR